MSNNAKYICDDCGYSTNNPVAFDIHPCRPSNGVNWNSRKTGANSHKAIVAAIAAILFAASLFVAAPAKAQSPEPTPTPTETLGGGPHIIEMHRVYLPVIMQEDLVHGCDNCVNGRYWGGQQAVSWCPTCKENAS